MGYCPIENIVSVVIESIVFGSAIVLIFLVAIVSW